MSDLLDQQPRLRPVEAYPLNHGEDGMYVVRDPTGLGEGMLTLSEPALFILSLFDGEHSMASVRETFFERYDQRVSDETLTKLIGHLQTSRLLEGPEFDAYVESLTTDYRESRVREAIYASTLGDADAVRSFMSGMLPREEAIGDGHVVGLIAPHLDYPRGEPCYRESYRRLWGRQSPTRCVILGTNHFGRSTSVTATGKSFETPLGVTPVDTAFLERVESRCEYSLRVHEFDHRREHSVELQVLCLQHVFGASAFRIVPFLCPDPCGPTGTKPIDGEGVDLYEFADALSEVIRDDEGDTLLIAGADLSHIGRQFGDSFVIDEPLLSEIERRDRGALAHLEKSEPTAFVAELARDGNSTRVCSAGCMSVVARVLQDARPTLCHYHQAFDEPSQVCVSCAAISYVR